MTICRRQKRNSLRRKRDPSPKDVQHDDAKERKNHEASEAAKQCCNGRQDEDVKTDVAPEHRIIDAERGAVDEFEKVHPAACGAKSEQERKHEDKWRCDFGQ